MNNGFRGSHLPPARRLTKLDAVRSRGGPSAAPVRAATSSLTNEAVLADYLAVCGAMELNLVAINRDGRTGTNALLADLTDLIDLVTLRTSHGREPSTLNKELAPGLFMSSTPVQEAVGEWGIQGAIDALQEGLATLGPRALAPPGDDRGSPMMWLLSTGNASRAETLYRMMDDLYRPHRHMWSHAETPDDTLRWAILYQLTDAEMDRVFPALRGQAGYAVYERRSDSFLDRLTPQTGNTTNR